MVNLTPWFHALGTVGYLNLPVLAGATLVLRRRSTLRGSRILHMPLTSGD